MDLKEKGCESVDQIQLSLVSTVTNLQIS